MIMERFSQANTHQKLVSLIFKLNYLLTKALYWREIWTHSFQEIHQNKWRY